MTMNIIAKYQGPVGESLWADSAEQGWGLPEQAGPQEGLGVLAEQARGVACADLGRQVGTGLRHF